MFKSQQKKKQNKKKVSNKRKKNNYTNHIRLTASQLKTFRLKKRREIHIRSIYICLY